MENISSPLRFYVVACRISSLWNCLLGFESLHPSRKPAAKRAFVFSGIRGQILINLCPETNRRSLQRDLKPLIDQKLIFGEGSPHHQEYKLL